MMPLGPAFYRGRVEAVQQALATRPAYHDLAGLLLLDSWNVIYVTGFVHSVSERPIGCYIPRIGEPVLFVPLLEQENAADMWRHPLRTYFEYPGETPPVHWMLGEIGAGLGAAAVGLDRVPHELCGSDAVRRCDLADRLRWVKTPEELALVRLAAGYADDCLTVVRDQAADIIRGGGTELDILHACVTATQRKMQAELEERFGRAGMRVTGTVHSGPRAALPHGATSDRQPQPGDTLIAGIGAMVGGYHAESGATFVIGEPARDTMTCLKTAAACDRAAGAALVSGATCAHVNRAALAVLRDAGLGDAIRHRIGHGMGLQGHEAPWLAPGDETVVQPGMVVSSEPGIYRPGRDGYRTINTYVTGPDGAQVYSQFLAQHPPERRVLPL